jgi:hypothetical protein
MKKDGSGISECRSPLTLAQRLNDALIVGTKLLLEASCQLSEARCLLVRADRSLALGLGCGEVVAVPSEILQGQSELTSELESGSSLGLAASWSMRRPTGWALA